MADKAVEFHHRVASVNGSQANGPWVRVAANRFSVQTDAPAPLAIVEVSNDRLHAIADTASLGDAMTEVTSRPMWARGAVASDTSAVRQFDFHFIVHKES